MQSYQQQNSSQTLADGIVEFYAAYSKYFADRNTSGDAEDFFKCHDVAHVVFGCDITPDNELIVKISSIFGTTAGFGVLARVRFKLPALLPAASIAILAAVLMDNEEYNLLRETAKLV